MGEVMQIKPRNKREIQSDEIEFFFLVLFLAFSIIVLLSFRFVIIKKPLSDIYYYISGAIGFFLSVSIMFMIFFRVDAFERKMRSAINNYIAEQKYDLALEYLEGLSLKKRKQRTNSLIYLFAGYLELLKDNVGNAINYYDELKKKGSGYLDKGDLVRYVFFQFIISSTCDEFTSLKDLLGPNYPAILVSIKRTKEFNYLVQAIFCIVEKDYLMAKNHLLNTVFMDVPIVKRYVDNMDIF
jgi:hypothetical protein